MNQLYTAAIGSVQDLILAIGNLINLLLPIVFGAALLVFFYGLAKFVLASGSEDAIKEGKNIMIWGVIALFVMASLWGIVAFLQVNLDLVPRTAPDPQMAMALSPYFIV